MTVTLDGTFDGKAIVMDEPLGLPANTRVRVTVEHVNECHRRLSFIETALSMNLDGPEDWSENYEEHLSAERGSTHD